MARETERDRFCSSDAQTIDAVEGCPTPCRCGGESPCTGMWILIVVFLGPCALSVSQGRGQALRNLLWPCTHVHPLPRGQRHRACVRAYAQTTATAAPDYNTSSSSSFVPVVPSPGACLPQRANPTLAVGRTCSFKVHTAAVLLQPYAPCPESKTFTAIILITKMSLYFRTVVRRRSIL